MATFDFPYHTVSTKYPESGARVQFGKSYQFASAPNAPDQRMFTLSFPMMKYYVDGGGDVEATTNPTLNMWTLEQFYQLHRLFETFTYVHSVLGSLTVRFARPLEVPKGLSGGDGATESFEIQLIEQP